MTLDQVCRQCGRCCERWGWGQQGTARDIVSWIDADRHDILQYVTICLKNGKKISGKEIGITDIPDISLVRFWQGPDGKPLRHCPFLGRQGNGKAFCRIHDVRPHVCREYAPWNCADGDYQFVRCQACRDRMP